MVGGEGSGFRGALPSHVVFCKSLSFVVPGAPFYPGSYPPPHQIPSRRRRRDAPPSKAARARCLPLLQFTLPMETHLKPSLATAVPLGATLSPQGNSLAVYPAVYPAASASPTAPPPSTGRQMVYFAQYDSTKYERLEFIVETYTLFSSLQVRCSSLAPCPR